MSMNMLFFVFVSGWRKLNDTSSFSSDASRRRRRRSEQVGCCSVGDSIGIIIGDIET